MGTLSPMLSVYQKGVGNQKVFLASTRSCATWGNSGGVGKDGESGDSNRSDPLLLTVENEYCEQFTSVQSISTLTSSSRKKYGCRDDA